jgi:hypothetical protein
MKNLFKIVVCLAVFVLSSPCLFSLTLEADELLYLNSISRFIDNKPEGTAVKRLQKSLKSDNPCVKGVGALILFKHFGRPFKRVFKNSFTLNQDIDEFTTEERKFIRLANVNYILEQFSEPLGRITDERVRRIFMFFHFRSIDLWLLGASGEKLSMAVFYRISALAAAFGPKVDSIALAASTDKL